MVTVPFWLLAASGTASGQATATPAYRQASRPIEERVADLVARMTPEEKVAELRSGLAPVGSPTAASGIPILFHADAQEPAWPRPLGLAASWDPELVREVHAEIAARARARGARLLVAPSLEVARDPRLGRIERTFGADSHLASELGIAAINGLQGSAGPGTVLAAVSGFAGPGSPRPGTDVSPQPVSERELREVYFPPFEAAVRRGRVAAVVLARNEIDAVPSHASPWLLGDVLRGEWGFAGPVLADHGGVADLGRVYRVATDGPQAGAIALGAGIDAALDRADAASLAAGAGAVGAARVDAAVAAILRIKLRAGLFDEVAVTSNIAAVPRLPPVALLAAQRSVALLKNGGMLPLAAEAGDSRPTIAVIEPAGGGLAAELRARLSARAVVLDESDEARAGLVVLAVNDAARGETRLEALKRAGKLVTVVLVGERPDVTVRLAEGADALVAAWSLGDACDKAVAAVLSGEVNPGGKLPLALARNPGQWPMFHDVKPSARRGYLFDTTEPLYPFGFGLGYSSFDVGAPRLSAASIDAKGAVNVSVDVRNTGRRDGDETVQLYVRDKVASVARPVKSLKGFQRVRLAAGESRTVTFTLEAASLAMWDGAMRRVLEAGEFDVLAGPDSARLKSATLTVRGATP